MVFTIKSVRSQKQAFPNLVTAPLAGEKFVNTQSTQNNHTISSMATPRKLELLAPAKNLEVGMAALLAGADAVYIGGSGFGARAAAGNSLQDIATLCAFAHRFGAKVYLTVNTLLFDHELTQVGGMIEEAVQAGVDALIVQDPAILDLPQVQNLEIHASTQWNINTLDKVAYCQQLGLSQVVLPREFSTAKIQEFCTTFPNMRFEVFVSGAMCVSVSGQCFISEYMTKRSANRGECAQICRLPMELYHEDIFVRTKRTNAPLEQNLNSQQATLAPSNNLAKPTLIAQGHLLSMKDNLRLQQLEALVKAGAVSFKIEGRLKDRDYVVNQVAAFRERLDFIIDKHPDLYAKSSLGQIQRNFQPDVHKTFNRGFTHAYLADDNSDLVEMRTPKSFGQSLGKVRVLESFGTQESKEATKKRLAANASLAQAKAKSKAKGYANKDGRYSVDSKRMQQDKSYRSAGAVLELTLNQATTLSNGDSFTYFDTQGELQGFRVNRVALSLRGNDKDVSTIQAQKGEVVYLFLAQAMDSLNAGCMVYRNVDVNFIKQLEQADAIQRKVEVNAKICFSLNEEQQRVCSISFTDAYQRQGCAKLCFEKTEQAPLSLTVMQDKLAKLGDKYVELGQVSFEGDSALATLPISSFNQLRREALANYISYVQLSRTQLIQAYTQREHADYDLVLQGQKLQQEMLQSDLSASRLTQAHSTSEVQDLHVQTPKLDSKQGGEAELETIAYLDTSVTDKVYRKPLQWPKWPENYVDPRLVTNKLSRNILSAQQEQLQEPRRLIAQAVMTCRTCLIKNHATCHKIGGKTSGYYLMIGGQRFDLVTDCKRCLMYVIPQAVREM